MARKKSLRNVGKFILRQDRKSNPKNEYPLYIQYTLDGKVAKGETGVWVQTKDWDDNRQRVKGSHPMAERLNKIIDAKKLSVDTMVLEYLNGGNTLTIEVLRQIVIGTFSLENKKDADLIQFANDNLDYRYKTDKISISTCDNGHCAMNGFKKFVKQKYHQETMMFSQLTETVIDEYIIWRKFSVYACGLRFSDIMTLEWSQINFETNRLTMVLVKGKVPHSFMLNGAALVKMRFGL